MFSDDPSDPDEPSDFERLTKFLTAPVHQFGLAIATANNTHVLAEVRARAAAIAADAKLRLVSIDVAPAPPPLPDQLITAARSGVDVLFVNGLESLLLDRYGGAVFSPDIEQLNWHRDRLAADLVAKVVFWMPRSAARALANAARDLNDVVLTRFHFVDADPGAVEPLPLPVTRDSQRGITKDDERRVPLLDTLIASRPPGTIGWANAAMDRARIALKQSDTARAKSLIEETIAIYDRLGELRAVAVAWALLAEILRREKEPQEAIRVIRDHSLPRALASGDLRTVALVQGQLARLLEEAGQLDEAFLVVRDGFLPVAEKLHDSRILAMARRDLATHLAARGDPDGALRLLRTHVLPVVREVGDLEEELLTLRLIGGILFSLGEVEESLATVRDELLPAAIRLGDPLEHAIALAVLADLLVAGGRREHALAIFRDEVQPLAVRAGAQEMVAAVRRRIEELTATVG